VLVILMPVYSLLQCFGLRPKKYCLYFTVAPQWLMEPQDVATLAGGSLMVHCQAQGFPQPQITWMRGQGRRTKDKYCIYFISI
jgi:hypothetical protein